ncbi:MFS transporter [Novosphingobium mathurense]|uniref:Fucose permease n=1 Tax=Novosphingobium mathurense TaxID=428990 RepID=A0A1U6HYF1_9SPHN|nr:MFS transporter [Novosphingobium mathurense]SLK00736.1 Fucose permease [Novosphingobium mathurense]
MDSVLTGGRGAIAWRAFLCQNLAVGAAFGGFGIAVLPMQELFDVGRGLATLGLALAVLVMGAAGPLVANLIARFGHRTTILSGIALSGIGYLLLALAPTLGPDGIYLVLFAYCLPIGIGLVMFGPFAASMLVSGWFQPNPATALGFVNMPLLFAILPVAGAPIIATYGLGTFYLLLAGLHLLLLPIAMGVRDPAEHSSGHGRVRATTSMRGILSRPVFWLIAAGGGTLSAIGIVGVSHLVAFGVERGIAEEQAAMLLSATGAASVVGSLAVGMMCGYLGAARALALIGLVTAAGWGLLLATTNIPVMLTVVLLVGAGGAGVFPAVNVLAGQIFGVGALHRVIGLYGLANLPFTFLLPPLAGVLHDRAGGYGPVVMSLIASAVVVALLFLGLSGMRRRGGAAAEMV